MWSLIIMAFWWMPQSSDAATSVNIPGFSSKATCIRAGEQYIKDAGTDIILKKSDAATHKRSVYYYYQCVEIK